MNNFRLVREIFDCDGRLTSNITEELMMKYVEGNLDSTESEKFEKILSQNNYLNRRVSILKSMTVEGLYPPT